MAATRTRRRPSSASPAPARPAARAKPAAAPAAARAAVPAVATGLAKLDLAAWIRANRAQLTPPVSNKQLFNDSQDAVVFVSGGPNTRNDYHVNPTEELFLQIKGDIAVRIRPLDGSAPKDVVIREGELYLLPRWVPHRPQRPAGTVGLIVEFPRPPGELDGLQWYCPSCDALVRDVRWRLKKIDEDLAVIMNEFWGGAEADRTCKSCGHVIQRAGAITLAKGKVRAAAPNGALKPAARRSRPTSAAARAGRRP